ncbi:MAG: ATP-binding protein [Gammaproteobacteria bacterium]|nr:ATP-binding protein [Gammaproteobacteria bacterium]
MLRGARQVGKTHLIRQFGLEFENHIEINFEKDRQAKQFFHGSLDPKLIIQKIAAYAEKPIIPGKTLLFFDEIQECEQAITALRYFKEEMQALHVVAAGSLIDFKLKHIGMPVGRVQFLYLYPLSFSEYCTAIGRDQLFSEAQKQLKLTAPLHDILIEEVKRYCWLGGMPAVLDAWIEHGNYALCQEAQEEILFAYRQDFNTYTKDHQLPYIERVFSNIDQQLGQKFKYATVDSDTRAVNLRDALDLLETAGIIHRIYHSAAQGLPLSAGIDERRFKVYFFDIGLIQRLSGLSMKDWLFQPLAVSHIGHIVEQFVQQEYIAYTAQHSPPELFYWHREAKQSNAEVDFLFIKNGKIIPTEVKSGHSGRLKSLKLFLDSHPHSPYGLKISESNEADFNSIEAIPLYAIQGWLSAQSN